jgi:4'-phosphopantetheinyl transferase EntD
MRTDIATIGIDAEMHYELPIGVLAQVAVAQELAWLRMAPAGIYWDKLLFSAKESVFKAWFPLTGRWLDFDDAVVSFEPKDRSFRVQLLVSPPLGSAFDTDCLTGRFLVQEELIMTAVTVS